MSGRDLLALLCRKPLSYKIARQAGSHRTLRSSSYPELLFAFHDRHSIPPGLVRKILMTDIGLSESEARELVGG
jgi:predicted RNA binding protein YcfA (HicA-like mRNA interferase family)